MPNPAWMDAPEAGAQPGWMNAPEAAPLSLTPGTPGSDAAGRFASNFASAINPVPGIQAIANDPQGIRHGIEQNVFQPQADQFSKANDAAHGRGEFAGMTPMERASSAFGHGLAGAVPLVGPAAANAGEQIGEGDVAGGLGSATGLLSTMAVPELMRGTGRAISRGAEPIAENALGIRNVDRKFGRTPGRAALDETYGVRPGTVVSQAQRRISDLTAQRDAALTAAGNRGVTVSLAPTRAVVDNAITRAAAGNSETGNLTPIQEQLHEPRPGFAGGTSYAPGTAQPITYQVPTGGPGPTAPPVRVIPGAPPPLSVSELQSPMDALAIRQRLGNDFTKFDMARPVSREGQSVGNRAYGALTDEIHSAVPESAPLDRRISNLIPVKESADVKNIEASTPQQIMRRFGAKTGALAAGAAAGAASGHTLGGVLGGAIIPELLSNPTVQMSAARAMDAAGKVIRNPITGRVIQGGQFIRPSTQASQ